MNLKRAYKIRTKQDNKNYIIDSWRQQLKRYLEPQEGLTDVYEFGVFTGFSLVTIGNIFVDLDMPVRNLFGLDSFQGLPNEAENSEQLEWAEGNYNSMDHFEQPTVEECMQAVDQYWRSACRLNTKLKLIPGFYNDSLTEQAIVEHDMGPAIYVDIDCDLYTSSYTALDFMFKHKLIQPGTIIGYDDWGGTPGYAYGLNGESKAHKQICEKYNVECEGLIKLGTEYPYVQTAFFVNSIGG